MKKSFSYLLVFVLFSCGLEDESSFIASYKDNNLTLEEVLLNKPHSVDSATFVNEEINRWIKNQVILDKAKLYIDEDDKELQSKVNSYKEILIINRYQNELINNQFDTTILSIHFTKFRKFINFQIIFSNN